MRRSNMFQPYWTTSTGRVFMHAAISSRLKFERPTKRTLPSRTTSSSALIVSSNGVSRSGQCTRYTSTWSVPRFVRLLSIEALTRAALLSRMFGISRYAMPNFVTMIASSRREPSARAERTLGRAHAVALGGVEAVDPEIERARDGTRELLLLDRPVAAADLPAAESDGRDLEAGPSEWSILHGVLSRRRVLDERRRTNYLGSRGSPRTRSAMMLRWISLVPPMIEFARVDSRPRAHRPRSTAWSSSAVRSAPGPSTAVAVS